MYVYLLASVSFIELAKLIRGVLVNVQTSASFRS